MIMLISATMFAQEDKLNRAMELRVSNPALALQIMDTVIQHPQTKNDFYTWTSRAYIYYEIYKNGNEKLKLNSTVRDSILSSIKVSNQLKPDSEQLANNNRMIKALSSGYFKIAKILLEDSINYERSLMAFNRFKQLLSMVDPRAKDSKDIEYYVAVGSIYSNIFNEDNKKTKEGDIAKVALLKVIDMQPTNSSANLNLGLMYYNQAANLSKSLEYGADFTEIDAIQDNMIKLAKQSEKLIRTVYENDNKSEKAIQALYYIYRMLVDNVKFEEFKAKCKERNIDIGENKPPAPPPGPPAQEGNNNQQNKDK